MRALCTLLTALSLAACASDDSADITNPDGSVDITGQVFTKQSGDCADYSGSYYSEVRDEQQERDFTGSVQISVESDSCTLTSNSIPNHDFGGGGFFATPTSEVNSTVRLLRNPMAAAAPTPISIRTDNAVMRNGVKLDLLAAACYGVGPDPLGEERIGCFDDDVPWRYDPMSGAISFGTDEHNAHTQPDGAYHYHGSPEAMYDLSGTIASPVIGFAADGFPIFGPFIDDEGTVRAVTSSYRLKQGQRTSQPGEGAFPGGDHDGTFRDDYEFVEGLGDLDSCNGMSRNGVYGYYVTASYPWVLACFTGEPDPSFDKDLGGPPS